MVVDLVRNDLARVCKEGTVKVDELFGIYSFPQVHQMISTVRGELKDEISFSEIIRSAFPMGSMTGAPKKKSDGTDRSV
jgi:para-aminobenzoate synthetase component 1